VTEGKEEAMSEQKVKIALSPMEWRLISELRAVPSSVLKEKVLQLFAAVVEFAREPRCAEVQADGSPCDTPSTSCEQCLHVDGMLDALRKRTVEARGLVGTPV
jgi:hypothetical protein